jgi:LPXTG-site transpeptidase (sortase) family protein
MINLGTGEKKYKIISTDWVKEDDSKKLKTMEGEITLLTCSWSDESQRIAVNLKEIL